MARSTPCFFHTVYHDVDDMNILVAALLTLIELFVCYCLIHIFCMAICLLELVFIAMEGRYAAVQFVRQVGSQEPNHRKTHGRVEAHLISNIDPAKSKYKQYHKN
jgi:hypothetical protein